MTQPPAGKAMLLAEAGFTGLLLLLLVTLHPFPPPAPATVILSAIEPVASDPWRQISFTAIFAVSMAAALWRDPAIVLRTVPAGVAVLLGWCLLSAAWSDAPELVLRRAILITEVSLSALLGVAAMGPERAFARLRGVLLLVLVINWIAIPIIPQAVHLPGESDPKLIGNWRGLYEQKNVAGAVCALTVLQYLFPGARARKWWDWLVIAAAIGFLVMTKSKTSMALLPVAAGLGLLYRRGWKDGLDRALLATATLLLLGAAVTLALLNTDLIAHVMQDPDAFTGRTEIWQADLAYLRDHPLLGAGFDAVFATGGQSVLTPYLHGRDWVADVSNSHNGYLDICLSLGILGLALAVVVLVVLPMARFWPLNFEATRDGWFATFAFVILHNFTEADFLAPDGVLWLVFLMVLGALAQEASAEAPAMAYPIAGQARSHP